jgi:hypothetical protein
MVQNGLFFCREAPWSHLGANTIPSGPPQAPSGPSLELPKTRKIAPGTPTSAQGPHQIHQANMLKTLEIHVLDPSGPHKSALGRFCDAPSLALRPSKATPRSSGSPLGAQKVPRSVQGLLKELPRTPSGAPGGGVRDFVFRPDFRTPLPGSQKDPLGPPKTIRTLKNQELSKNKRNSIYFE